MMHRARFGRVDSAFTVAERRLRLIAPLHDPARSGRRARLARRPSCAPCHHAPGAAGVRVREAGVTVTGAADRATAAGGCAGRRSALIVALTILLLGQPGAVWAEPPAPRWAYGINDGYVARALGWHQYLLKARLDADRTFLLLAGRRRVDVVALDTEGGKEVWAQRVWAERAARWEDEADHQEYAVTRVQGRLVVAQFQRYTGRISVTALDASDGRVLWRAGIDTTRQPGSFVEGEEIALEGSGDAIDVWVLRAKTGNRVSFGLSDGQVLRRESYPVFFWPQQAHRVASVIIGYDGQFATRPTHLVGLQEGTAQELWRLPISRGVVLAPVPILGEDAVVFADANHLRKVDAATGQVLWNVEIGGYGSLAVGVVGDRVVMLHGARRAVGLYTAASGTRIGELPWDDRYQFSWAWSAGSRVLIDGLVFRLVDPRTLRETGAIRFDENLIRHPVAVHAGGMLLQDLAAGGAVRYFPFSVFESAAGEQNR